LLGIVLEIVSNDAESKVLRIRTEIETGAVPVRGDSFRLRQILLNLIDNAIKFTVVGEVVVRLHTLKEDGEHIEIYFTIQDEGIGITPEDQERLFEPFGQVNVSAARHNGGSGLGLAICKRLAEAMGGQIGVESRFGAKK